MSTLLVYQILRLGMPGFSLCLATVGRAASRKISLSVKYVILRIQNEVGRSDTALPVELLGPSSWR